MAKEQKEWWWKLGVTIVGALATFVAANNFPFGDKENNDNSNKS